MKTCLILNGEGRRTVPMPEPVDGLHVHGRIVSLEHLPEEGGKPVVQLELDTFQQRNRESTKLKRGTRVSFFYPNFFPEKSAWVTRCG